MCLTARWGTTIVVATVCQTWKCRRCGPKRKLYAAMRAEHGSTYLDWPGQLSLITLTYMMREHRDIVSATSALSDFRRFAQLLRRTTKSTFRWFRVPEATRRGQVHWHVISGDLIGNRFEKERTVRDAWALATRKKGVVVNYVVDVSETTAKGSAGYVAKYLLKTALGFTHLKERGFKRRWTCSRDWTTPEKTRLSGTERNAWVYQSFIGPFDADHTVAVGRRAALVSSLAHRVGDPLVLTLEARNRKRALASQIKRSLGGSH